MDYYNILGIEKNASQSDIKKAYYKLAKEHHPDRGGAQEKFKACNEAYEILSNTEKKETYDRRKSIEINTDLNQSKAICVNCNILIFTYPTPYNKTYDTANFRCLSCYLNINNMKFL